MEELMLFTCSSGPFTNRNRSFYLNKLQFLFHGEICLPPLCLNTCSHFQRKFELKTYVAERLLSCIKFVFKTLINHYKIINNVLINYTWSTIDNGTYRWNGGVCLYDDTQSSCCCCLTLPRQRVCWRRISDRMVCSQSLVFVWWGHRTGTDRPCPTSVLWRC